MGLTQRRQPGRLVHNEGRLIEMWLDDFFPDLIRQTVVAGKSSGIETKFFRLGRHGFFIIISDATEFFHGIMIGQTTERLIEINITSPNCSLATTDDGVGQMTEQFFGQIHQDNDGRHRPDTIRSW